MLLSVWQLKPRGGPILHVMPRNCSRGHAGNTDFHTEVGRSWCLHQFRYKREFGTTEYPWRVAATEVKNTAELLLPLPLSGYSMVGFLREEEAIYRTPPRVPEARRRSERTPIRPAVTVCTMCTMAVVLLTECTTTGDIVTWRYGMSKPLALQPERLCPLKANNDLCCYS